MPKASAGAMTCGRQIQVKLGKPLVKIDPDQIGGDANAAFTSPTWVPRLLDTDAEALQSGMRLS